MVILVRGNTGETFLPSLLEEMGELITDTMPCLQAAAVALANLLLMHESYAYTLLDRKTKRLRKQTGNQALRSTLHSDKEPKELIKNAIVRPVKLLVLSPIVLLLSLYMAMMYGYQYLMFTTFPRVFQGHYGFSDSNIGLVYLGMGIGFLIPLIISGMYSDRLVRYLTQKYGGSPKPEYRLPFLAIGAILAPIGLFLYGWTAEEKVHWIVPIIGTAIVGAASLLVIVSHVSF